MNLPKFSWKKKFENTSPNIENLLKELVANQTTLKPMNLLEIGSRDGFDSYRISDIFGIKPENVFVVEPNPSCLISIRKDFPKYNLYPYAIFNKDGFLKFNRVTNENIGTSSLLDRNDNFYDMNSEKIEVECITGQRLLEKIGQSDIDICKIDVEGGSYEVLDSFGSKIKQIKLIHIESEHLEIWKGQKLYDDVSNLLVRSDFHCVYFRHVGNAVIQSDSVWVNSELLKWK